jgi:preprotein translocase subunit SecF
MDKKIFTENTRIYLMISAAIIAVALIMSVFGLGMNLGIDFTGGSLLKYEMGAEFDVKVVEAALKDAGIAESQIAKAGENMTELQIRTKDLGENADDLRVAFEEKLAETYPEATFITIDTVGAVAGKDLIANAVKSCLIVFVCLLIYIAIRFDLNSGLAALVALAHDILIMVSFMVFARGIFQVNSPFIAAALTIIGYSINNTIVVFDRIRENNRLLDYKEGSRQQVVEISVGQTLARTINTTITTLVTLVVLYILGVDSIREFTFPLIIGMLAGVYSSVMLSGQIWAHWIDHKTFAPITNLFKGKKAKKA